jgi:hypothetical protein
MRTLMDQHHDAAMALGSVQRSFQPTAVVISVDAQGNLVLEQKLQPGVPLDSDNPAHRVANWLVNNAQQVLCAAFDAPMQDAAPRIIQLN